MRKLGLLAGELEETKSLLAEFSEIRRARHEETLRGIEACFFDSIQLAGRWHGVTQCLTQPMMAALNMIALDVSEQLLSEEVVEEEVRKEVSDRLEEFIGWVAEQQFEPGIRSEALSSLWATHSALTDYDVQGMRTFRVAFGFAAGTYAQFGTSTLIDLEIRDDFLARLREIMKSLGKLWCRAAPFGPVLGSAIRVAKAALLDPEPSSLLLPGDEPSEAPPNDSADPASALDR